MVAGLAVTVHRFFFPKLTVQALPFPPVLTEGKIVQMHYTISMITIQG
jgi:hypothetical protein